MSEVKGCHSFVCKAKPFLLEDQSTVFAFGGYRWSLRFVKEGDFYFLILINLNLDDEFRPFRVKCFADYRPEKVFETLCDREESSYVIWKIHSRAQYIEILKQEFAEGAEIEFFVIFAGKIGSTFDPESTDAKRAYTTLDLESLSSDFGNLLANGDASDVQLKCKGVARRAHRSVLAARSEVFSAMFRNKMAESTSGVVDIDDLDLTLLDLLLEYVYTGKVSDIPTDRVHELYAVADKYAVHNLKKMCSGSMVTTLSEDNYQTFLITADTHSDEKFKTALTASIVNHPEWLDCEAWHTFAVQHSKLGIEVYRKLCDKTGFFKSEVHKKVETRKKFIEH